MPSYIQQIRRMPKPGKSESVLQHSIERLKSLNRRGNVNFTVSASGESEGAIATDIPISSVSDLELFHDAFRNSPDSIKAFDEISEECAKVELQIYRVVEPGVQPEGGAKYNARNILVAKREALGAYHLLITDKHLDTNPANEGGGLGQNIASIRFETSGGGEGNRTLGPLHAKQVLSR